jgi:hypothetical protein
MHWLAVTFVDKLSETELRDLIAYLSGAAQVPLPAIQ